MYILSLDYKEIAHNKSSTTFTRVALFRVALLFGLLRRIPSLPVVIAQATRVFSLFNMLSARWVNVGYFQSLPLKSIVGDSNILMCTWISGLIKSIPSHGARWNSLSGCSNFTQELNWFVYDSIARFNDYLFPIFIKSKWCGFYSSSSISFLPLLHNINCFIKLPCLKNDKQPRMQFLMSVSSVVFFVSMFDLNMLIFFSTGPCSKSRKT